MLTAMGVLEPVCIPSSRLIPIDSGGTDEKKKLAWKQALFVIFEHRLIEVLAVEHADWQHTPSPHLTLTPTAK
jgi:hypothetical protein